MTYGFTRFLKYSLVGTATLVFDLFLLYVFTDLFGIHYLLSAGLAFIVAVSVNYAIGREFVFRGTLRSVRDGYAIFILIALTGLLIVTGGMYVLVEIFGLGYLAARLIAAAVAGLWNYLMNLYVNFKVAGKL